MMSGEPVATVGDRPPSATLRRSAEDDPKKKSQDGDAVSSEVTLDPAKLESYPVQVLRTYCKANDLAVRSQKKEDYIKVILAHLGDDKMKKWDEEQERKRREKQAQYETYRMQQQQKEESENAQLRAKEEERRRIEEEKRQKQREEAERLKLADDERMRRKQAEEGWEVWFARREVDPEVVTLLKRYSVSSGKRRSHTAPSSRGSGDKKTLAKSTSGAQPPYSKSDGSVGTSTGSSSSGSSGSSDGERSLTEDSISTSGGDKLLFSKLKPETMNHIRKFVEYQAHGRQRVETAQKTYDLPAAIGFKSKQVFSTSNPATTLGLVGWKKSGAEIWETWAGDERGTLTIWEIDLQHGKIKPRSAGLLKKLPRHPAAEPIVAILQVGDQTVWTVGKTSGIYVWAPHNLHLQNKMPCEGTTSMVSWKRGREADATEFVFTAGDEGVIRIWSATKYTCLQTVHIGWKVRHMAVVSTSLWVATQESILVYRIQEDASSRLKLMRIFASPRPTTFLLPSRHHYQPWEPDTASSSRGTKRGKDKDEEGSCYRVWTGTDQYVRVFEFNSKTKEARPIVKLVGGGPYPIAAMVEMKEYIISCGSSQSTFAVWDAKSMRYIGELNRQKVWKGELKHLMSASPTGRRNVWAADSHGVQVWSCYFD